MMRVQDHYPQVLTDELLRLARKDPNWVRWKDIGSRQVDGQMWREYRAWTEEDTWVKRICNHPGDLFGQLAVSRWLVDGPKFFAPTPEQCTALERVDVNLGLEDYHQPYPALMVTLDVPPFRSCLCFHDGRLLVCVLGSEGNRDDIVTTVATDGRPLEASIQRYDADCTHHARQAGVAMRIALNACLALAHFGAHAAYLMPKDVASDQRLARENTPRGLRARGRLSLAVQTVGFSQQVDLGGEREAGGKDAAAPPTGRQMPAHWRRGHWRMQVHGAGRGERRRVFIKPVLVRADLFVGDRADTQTEYRG